MQQEELISWLVRGFLSALGVGMLIGLYLLIKGKKETWHQLWDALNKGVRRQVLALLVFTTICLVITVLSPLTQLPVYGVMVLAKLQGVLWVVVGAWSASLVLSIIVSTIQWRYDVDVADNLLARRMHTRMRVLQRIVAVLIGIAAIAGMLMQFDTFRALGTTLLASAGILSVVLGISAQKTFGSIIAGIQVALSHPINLDDVVIVEGEWGRIEEISFTYVVVKIWDQRRLIVPITYFLETPFQNWTRTSADITGSVFLNLDYATPMEPLRKEALRLCEVARPMWDGKTCVLQVTDAGPENMTIRVLVSSPDASKAWDLRCQVREGLIDFVKSNYPDCLPKRRVVMEKENEYYG